MSHCEAWSMKNTLQKANPALKHFLQSFFIKATDAVTHAEESLKDKDHVGFTVCTTSLFQLDSDLFCIDWILIL